MAFLDVHFYGEKLGKQSSMYVIMPQGKKGPFPVLYLLHGLSDDNTIWLRRTRIEHYVRDLPLIVVMPDGGRSFYVNSANGPYEDHIVSDVVNFVDATFPTVRNRTGRALAGLSMGGWGSMLLGLKHPDMFAAVSSHSGAFLTKEQSLENADRSLIAPAFACRTNDIRRLAREALRKPKRPAIRFDCGTEDFLIGHNRAMHAYYDNIGLTHDYFEHPGTHEWNYWDLHIQETLNFVMKNVKRR